MGLENADLEKLSSWVKDRSATLRFIAEEQCEYLSETEKKVESSKYTSESRGFLGTLRSFSSKVVTKVMEYSWKYKIKYEVCIFKGNDPEDKVVLQDHKTSTTLKTLSKEPPRPPKAIAITQDVNITYMLKNLDSNLSFKFLIDRLDEKCFTPRRNPDVDQAVRFLKSIYDWAEAVRHFFMVNLFPLQDHNYDLSYINDSSLFVPILPFFDRTKSTSTESPASPRSPTSPREKSDKKKVQISLSWLPRFEGGAASPMSEDVDTFIFEQKRMIEERFEVLESKYPKNSDLVRYKETRLVLLMMHSKSICQQAIDAVGYIEEMLMKQLISAIGRELTPVDFTNYMAYHYRLLFKEEYQPRPFSYAIRRPNHYPEGVLSIEAQLDDGSLADPIPTIAHKTKIRKPMYFPINASTNVSFYGERYVHGWMGHQFDGDSGLKLSLVARARQFSSFVLIAGRILAADVFEPKYALIIQNKDDLRIPLMLETIPTAKEFKEAISSLSPEQQRFSKAYRSMQLSSTLFGVVTLQIKPQLEKLLKLPNGSLTKELKLMQDLLDLLITYQIPSDQLSYDGDEKANPVEKINQVKEYVKVMQEMIHGKKQDEIKEAILVEAFENPELINDDIVKECESESECDDFDDDECEIEEERCYSAQIECEEAMDINYDLMECKSSIMLSDDAPMMMMKEEMVEEDLAPVLKSKARAAPQKMSKKREKEEEVVEKKKVKRDEPKREKMADKKMSAPKKDKEKDAPAEEKSRKSVAAPKPAAKQQAQKKQEEQPQAKQQPPQQQQPQQPQQQQQQQPQQDQQQQEQKPAEPKKDDPKPEDNQPEIPEPKDDTEEVEEVEDEEDEEEEEEIEEIDVTKIPSTLDKKFEELDEDAAVRPTIIHFSEEWTKKSQKSLLSKQETQVLLVEQQGEERKKAFDLLDALSRSGNLPFDQATLHVVVGATHCFAKSLLNTVIQDNMNPIEKLERSLLIMTSTITQEDPAKLIKEEQYARASLYCPAIFGLPKPERVNPYLEFEKAQQLLLSDTESTSPRSKRPRKKATVRGTKKDE
eukprot:TRINITY_DN251_c0_g4_i1.p1 TRINITY_DN251_c0_g4~~TRINITY_DN251_c0_g4_i1.p1  ORF type:complete len:1123 (+),score=394.88 TRINITY_DN251_c0_g4_i1:223-3369(+)